MHRCAVMALLAAAATEVSIDTTRASQIALVHDIGEAIVGDFTPHDKIAKDEKARLEEVEPSFPILCVHFCKRACCIRRRQR